MTRSKTSQGPQSRLKSGDKLCTSSSNIPATPAHAEHPSASATISFTRGEDTDAVDRQGRTDAQSQKAALREEAEQPTTAGSLLRHSSPFHVFRSKFWPVAKISSCLGELETSMCSWRK